MFLTCIFACLFLHTGTEPSPDRILTIDGRVSSVGFADLDGDGLKDLLVMVDPDPEGSGDSDPLQIFLQKPDRTFQPLNLPEAFPKDELFLMDTGNYASFPGDELLLVTLGKAYIFGIDAEGRPDLYSMSLSVPPLFYAAAHHAPHLLRFSADLDSNGFDEAIIPSQQGLAVCFCQGERGFDDPVFLDDALDWSIQFSENALFSVMTTTGKVKILDRAGENPLLVTEKDGRILSYQYDQESESFLQLVSVRPDFSSYSQEQEAGTVEYKGIIFSEDNRDDLPSFVVSHRMGRAGIMAELKTEHTAFTLIRNQETRTLHFRPVQRIVTDGISAPAVFSDLNADGCKDLVLIYVRASFLTKVLEMFLDRVVITCQVHLFDKEKKRYAFEPAWSEEVSVPTRSFRVIGAEGLIQFNRDYDGDGRPDMLVFDSDRLLIKRGERDEGFFSAREISFQDRAFYQIGGPFPGPVITEDIDGDDCAEIISVGGRIVRIVYVR